MSSEVYCYRQLSKGPFLGSFLFVEYYPFLFSVVKYGELTKILKVVYVGDVNFEWSLRRVVSILVFCYCYNGNKETRKSVLSVGGLTHSWMKEGEDHNFFFFREWDSMYGNMVLNSFLSKTLVDLLCWNKIFTNIKYQRPYLYTT